MAYRQKYEDHGYHDLNQEETDVSKINAAGLINLRVQESWGACRRYYNDGDYNSLRDELAALWPEFYADATSQQVREFNNLNKAIALSLKERWNNRKNKKQWLYFNIKYKAAVYQTWLFLKTLEKAQGVGKAYIDADRDDWE